MSVILLVLMIVLLSMNTLQEVKQNEFAVEYNTYTCHFNKVLSQGKYTTQVGTKFFHFGRTLKDLNLGVIECMTADQVLVKLDVNMQIQYYREYRRY